MQAVHEEHRYGLEICDQIETLLAQDSGQAVGQAVAKILQYYDDHLEAHLQLEEQKMMRPLIQTGPQYRALCLRIGQEHGSLRHLVLGLRPETARRDLPKIITLLRTHTAFEDQELLPLLPKVLGPEQLATLTDFTPQIGRAHV